MESVKRKSKKILIVLVILAMLINIFPNFGLLINVSNAVDDNTNFSGLILRLNQEKGIWTDSENGNRGISLDIIMKDMNFSSFVLPITFDTTQVKPAYINNGKLEYANSIYQFTSDMKNNIFDYLSPTGQVSETDWSKISEGKFILDFYNTNGIYPEYYEAVGEQLVGTMNFIVDASIMDVSQIDSGVINIDKSSDVKFNIYNYDLDEYYDDIDRYFSLQGMKILPTVQKIEVKTPPTNGTTYTHGDTIDLTGGVLTATYTEGEPKDIEMNNQDVIVKTGDRDGAFADVDNPQITFKYGGKTAELPITVQDPVTKIEGYNIDEVLSTKDIINDGDSILGLALQVKATKKSVATEVIDLNNPILSLSNKYADTEDLRAGTEFIEPVSGEISGIQDIIVTYDNNNAIQTNFSIVVNDTIDYIEISSSNQPQTEYFMNDEFKKNGAIVVYGTKGHCYGEVEMASDSVKVTDAIGNEVKLNEINPEKEIKVSFAGKETSYKINIKNKIESIRVNLPNGANTLLLDYNKDSNEVTQTELNGITITEIYADKTEGETKDLNYAWIDFANSSYNRQTIAENQFLLVKYECDSGTLEGKIPVNVQDRLLGISIKDLKTECPYKQNLDYTGAELYLQYVNRRTWRYYNKRRWHKRCFNK